MGAREKKETTLKSASKWKTVGTIWEILPP